MKNTWQERLHEWRHTHGRESPEDKAIEAIWSNRGYLPHLNSSKVVQSITFGLVDALPKDVVKELLATATESELPADRRRKIEGLLDSGYGCCVLRDDRIAQALKNSILGGETREFYRLHAWVIMPNHVHALLQAREGITLGRIVKAWKRAAWDSCRDHLGRRGPLWNDDYWDRKIRDERHHAAVVKYLLNNPVKAGLVKQWSDWKWTGLHAVDRE